MTRLRSIGVKVAIGLIVLSLRQLHVPLNAQQVRLTSVRELRQACAGAAQRLLNPRGARPDTTVNQKLRALGEFCEWQIPAESDSVSWNGLKDLAIRLGPILSDPALVAGLVRDGSGLAVAEAGSGVVSRGAGAAGAGTVANAILWGLTDFVVDRAGEEVQAWLVPRLAGGLLCRGWTVLVPADSALDSVLVPAPLPETCVLLGSIQAGTWMTGAAFYRGVVSSAQRDVAGLPSLLLQQSIAVFAKQISKDTLALDALASGLMATRFFGALVAEAPAPELFRALSGTDGVAGSAEVILRRLELDTSVTKRAFRAARILRVGKLLGQLDLSRGVDEAVRGLLLGCLQDSTLPTCDWLTVPGQGMRLTQAARELVTRVRRIAPLLEEAQTVIAEGLAQTGDAERRELDRVQRLTRLVEIGWRIVGIAADLGECRMPTDTATVLICAARRFSEGLASRNYGDAFLGLTVLLSEPTLRGRLFLGDTARAQRVTRAVAFARELAQARDAETAKRVIAAVAAPRGTSAAKRRSTTFLGVNAYLGAAYGWERLRRDAFTVPSGQYVGLALPVGLELSTSIRWRCPIGWLRYLGFGVLCRGSVGVFLQAIDLGALASVRLSETDSTTKLPEVGLRQVFAPGAYMVYGFSGAPISFGAGFSLAPELRSLRAPDGSTGNADASRFNLFLAVDVPIFAVVRGPR